ncbi:DUF554 domain-containing protein [Archaeoglobus veneficus]|uniref:DUF554 domain-containing protein n=1 Tax=Archaeoglobus veneficus (strain DSM 11195 / SNP6) TaxID=693661 RepID=F2KRP7_ARCVS|nr:DUF554 domain-containing protein [Archaeoglobus veneficus]AEA47911.1 protein of unknown function DUF554 [Archaeoglobus veneficus SNP6]
MLGTLINAATVLAASAAGILIGSRMPERMRESLMNALGLPVMLIGLSLALKMENFLVITASMLLGTAAGEAMGIEARLEAFGRRVEEKFKGSKFAEGFVASTLLYCVGPMAIIGPIQEGLTGDMSVLLAKSMLDGIASIALASTLGVGVAFSSLSVLAYQGFFSVIASFISPYMTEHVVNEISATGGLLIVAIGMNLLEIRKLRVGNMLPALLFAGIIAWFF